MFGVVPAFVKGQAHTTAWLKGVCWHDSKEEQNTSAITESEHTHKY